MSNPTVASLSISFRICHGSPYFHLGPQEMRNVERQLVAGLQSLFPKDVQTRWADIQDAPVGDFRGPQSFFAVKQFMNTRLRELSPPAGFRTVTTDGKGAETDTQTLTVSLTNDDECWVCEIIANHHICRRCDQLYQGGVPMQVTAPSSIGTIRADVLVELKFDGD